jgi:serine/threonine protein kinase
MIDYGMIIFTNFNTVLDLEEKVAGYFIMPKYKINLEDYFIRKNKIDPGFLFEVVLQLIDALKIVHISGRTYNDMKPENIMVQKDKSDEKYVVLIDFGFAEKFINEK